MRADFAAEELLPEYMKHIDPYIPSVPDPVLMKNYHVDRLYRLNNNENPLGPPPAARRVLEAYDMGRTGIYPSGDSYYLKRALAKKFSKTSDQFLVGNGSNEMISCVLKTFCQKGDNIITADRTYATYEWTAEFSGIEPILVPLNERYEFDEERILAAVNDRTKIIFICNPNNPTGTWWNKDRMEAFLQRVPDRIVVIDEAYGEFVEDPDFPDAMELMERYANVICFRTFSKMYGLAAVRVGYLCGVEKVISLVRRAYTVYSVNSLGQAAAQAAIEEGDAHIQATRQMVRQAQGYLRRELAGLGLGYQMGEGIFCMVKVNCPDTTMYRRLMRQGIMVRTMTGFRFPNWIRVSYSAPEVMEAFIAALQSADRSVGTC